MPLLGSFVLSVLLAPLAAADSVKSTAIPQPRTTTSDEPFVQTWSAGKAAEYLDGVGINWTRDRKCFTCHTNMPYMLGRPLLPGEGWKEVRTFAENQSAGWEKGEKPRGAAYVVVNALVLAFNDAQTTRTLHPRTRYALDRMWEEQLPTGEWKWLTCGWPPMEHDDYYGVTLAALAAGVAPGEYAQTEKAKSGLTKLKAYLAKHPAPDLHHKTMLLWAATKLDGLLARDGRDAIVNELKAKQQKDGGWSLPSLGAYPRRDGTANDQAAPSDGYATGLVSYVLMQAGVLPSDAALAQGVAWLKTNQRASGRWYTRSLNNDKAHYITNAGTAFAVLALTAAGIPEPSP